ncbi:MAG TPA: hypothetical protein VGG97_09305 [Bryobacteraceae bacterium]
MATLDWSQCPAVESIPGKVSGAWTFRNSRTPVRRMLAEIAAAVNAATPGSYVEVQIPYD